MSVVPDSKVDKISFYENHIDPWTTSATEIGTTTAAVTDLQTKTVAARDAYNAQQAAQAVAMAATLTLKNAMEAMGTAGAQIISDIRSKGKTAGDSVYVLAQIPAPATPAPVPPPGEPNTFKVALQNDGSIIITWKSTNPRGSVGTIYQVYRRLGGETGFTYIGGSGTRQYVDDEIPRGTSTVTYQIYGVRSTAIGPMAEFNVNFGTTSTGQMTATVEQTPRIAA